MSEVLSLIPSFGIKCAEVELDLTLARGLNYYTGTIYEVKAKDIVFGSIGGGGRYDDLTGMFGLPNMSGVGISFGADRIYDVMKEMNLFQNLVTRGTKVLLVNFGGDATKAALDALTQIRTAGIAAEIYPDAVKLGKQFTYADKKNIPWVVVVGESEIASGQWKLKNLASGIEEMLSPAEVINIITQA